MHNLWSRRRKGDEPPIELRFVDLFMILLTTLIFISVILSVISAGIHGTEPPEAPRIATRSIPAALEGRPYELTLAATGGSELRWELAAGRLPQGLRLGPDGSVTGTPARRGKTACRLRVRAGSLTHERDFAVVVQPPPGMSRPSPLRVLAPSVLLPRAEPEEPYRAELRMAGGHPPYRWQLVDGKLPSGVSWSPQGLVQGTPEDVEATGEDFSFAMRAMDGAGRQVVQQFTLAVRPPEKSVWRKRIERAVQVLYVLFILWWFWRGAYFPGLRAYLESRREDRSWR